MNKIELKPCPFCGGKARVVIKSFDVFMNGAFVICEKCGARTDLIETNAEYSAKDRAVEYWNKRV